jgi:hypothetical protein
MCREAAWPFRVTGVFPSRDIVYSKYNGIASKARGNKQSDASFRHDADSTDLLDDCDDGR